MSPGPGSWLFFGALALASTPGSSPGPFERIPAAFAGWEPILLPGSRSKSVSERGNELARLLSLVRAVSLSLEPDPRAARVIQRVRGRLGELDLRELHRILLEEGRSSPPLATLPLRGRLTEDQRFALELGARPQEPRAFGDLDLAIGLAPAGPRSFLLRSEASWRLEHLHVEDLVQLAKLGLRFFERTVDRSRSGPLASRRARASLEHSFPETARFLARYLRWQLRATTADGALWLRPRAALNMAKIRADFPKLAQAIDRSRGLVDLSFEVTTPDGGLLLKGKIDGNRYRLSLELATREGRLLVLGRDGRPSGAEIDFATLSRLETRTHARLRSDLSGLVITLEGIELSSSFVRDPARGVLRSALTKAPALSVTGAALDLLPVWMIDALIPSNLESIGRSFLTVLSEGNEGAGLVGALVLPAEGPGDLQASFEAELLENGFLSFGLRVASERMLRSDEEQREILRLRRRALDAFTSDFERFRASIRSRSSPGGSGEAPPR